MKKIKRIGKRFQKALKKAGISNVETVMQERNDMYTYADHIILTHFYPELDSVLWDVCAYNHHKDCMSYSAMHNGKQEYYHLEMSHKRVAELVQKWYGEVS